MANGFKCKICNYYEGSHDAIINAEQLGNWNNNEHYLQYAKQLKDEFPNICYNYEKTDEEMIFDKQNKYKNKKL